MHLAYFNQEAMSLCEPASGEAVASLKVFLQSTQR
jgi:hypothetical protein